MSTAAPMRLCVSQITAVAPDIRELVLRDPGSADLPAFTPGSHIVLDCGGQPNAYSLTGDGILPDCYAISVRLDPGGRGGSRWVHALREGDLLSCREPQDAFAPVATARHHLLVAGGIGITPILSHLRAARFWGRSTSLIYAVSGNGPVPHSAELDAIAWGDVRIVRGRAALSEAVETALRRQKLGTHLYICGPGGMIDRVLALANANGWPAERCHAERFGTDRVEAGQPFDVFLRRSNLRFSVPGDVSLLDALAAAGKPWPAMCRRGVCGECRLEGVAGVLVHNDHVLSSAERKVGTCLMPCVSRAEGVLTIDL